MDSLAVQRLTTLGQVWGFLKYFHPAVATGTVDWDSALVQSIPVALTPPTPQAFNTVLTELLDRAGPIPLCDSCLPESAFPDSAKVNLDFRWLRSGPLLSVGTVDRLLEIRRNRNLGRNRFAGACCLPAFTGEQPYNQPLYPSLEYRLLGLIRFWNQVQYYFPYKYINDGDWLSVLPEFTPAFAEASDTTAYREAVLRLLARLNDNHVLDLNLNNSVLGPRYPVDLRFVEGQFVVSRVPPVMSYGGPLRVGDIIRAIDGEPVNDRARRIGVYAAAGATHTFERWLTANLLRNVGDTIRLTIDRAGGPTVVAVPRVVQGASADSVRAANRPPPVSPSTGRPWWPADSVLRLLPGNIAYVDLARLERAHVDTIANSVLRATGLVFELRRGQHDGNVARLLQKMLPSRRPFARAALRDDQFPGLLQFSAPTTIGPEAPNPQPYRGRIAVLVDANTQSNGEFIAMMIRSADRAKLVGSATAGADGEIARLTFPGGVNALFSGVAVFWPDGRQTQRVGLQPDIPVRLSIAAIREGRDEILQRAIEYVQTGR